MKLNVLFEDETMVVAEKPAGVLSQSDRSTELAMTDHVKNYLYDKYGKGKAEVFLIHRLDRPVGGVMVFARTKEAAASLSKQVQDKTMEKHYLAVLNSRQTVMTEYKQVIDYLIKDPKTNLSAITTETNKQAKKAVLNYKIVASLEKDGEDLSLAEIELLTGRHHQIRVQMEKETGGLWGDTKYNKTFIPKERWVNPGLYSYLLSFLHPKTKKRMTLKCLPTEGIFQAFQEDMKKI